MTAAVYARILLRYLAGYLVIKGLLPEDIANQIANDPEVAAAVGIALTVAVETAYGLARKFGWAK